MLTIWRPLVTEHSLFTSLIFFSLLSLGCGLLVKRACWPTLRAVGVGAVLVAVRLAVPASLPGFTRNLRLPALLSRLYFWTGEPLWGPVTLRHLCGMVWALGSVAMLARLGIRLWRQRHVVGDSRPTFPTHLGRLYEDTLRELHCHKYGVLMISDSAPTAMVIGFFSPDILFPTSLEALPEKQQRYILCHEITHFLHHDLWIKLGLELICCLLWWNPAAYLLRTQVNQLLEMRCDARVCRDLGLEQVLDYSQTLLTAFHSQSGREAPVCPDSGPEQAAELSRSFLESFPWQSGKRFSLAAGYLGRAGGARVRQRFLQLLRPVRPTIRQRVASFAITIASVALFLGSYSVELVPDSRPPVGEMGETGVILDEVEEDFILRSPDGRLAVYLDMMLYGYLTPDQLEEEPFASLPVIDAVR